MLNVFGSPYFLCYFPFILYIMGSGNDYHLFVFNLLFYNLTLRKIIA